MRITKRKLAEMIELEVRSALYEADGDEKDTKKSKKPTTAAADDEPTELKPSTDGGGVEPIANAPPIDGGLKDQGPDDLGAEKPDEEGDDEEAIDAAGEAGEDPSGAVNDELSGKTVQAITIEPKSQVLPGAKEVIITFNESTDPLRILVTSTGQVKFFWRGQLHDIP